MFFGCERAAPVAAEGNPVDVLGGERAFGMARRQRHRVGRSARPGDTEQVAGMQRAYVASSIGWGTAAARFMAGRMAT